MNEVVGVAGEGCLDAGGDGGIGEDGGGLSSGNNGADVKVGFVDVHEELVERIEDWGRDCSDPVWGQGRRFQVVYEAGRVTLDLSDGRGRGGGQDGGNVGFVFGIRGEGVEVVS